jgi:hypothetical protein
MGYPKKTGVSLGGGDACEIHSKPKKHAIAHKGSNDKASNVQLPPYTHHLLLLW